ncbi:MAG TPA: hypothetical protein VFF06_14200 [Polyangia bacterium]|nr:hypothetical protein [Polyangia bacterium]
MSGKLQLRDGEHWLEDRPVPLNAAIELRLSAGRWLRCQYRWNGDAKTLPVFSVVLGGDWEQRLLSEAGALHSAPEAILRAELEDAEFRWPDSN